MRPLDLDFHRVPRASVAGWMLLVAAGLVLVALAGTHYALHRATASAQALLGGLAPRAAQQATALSAAGSGDAAALAAAQQVLARAAQPWDNLFGPLQTADGPDMALLSITPDSARGLVKIHAEARHLAAMLAYQQRLQADARLQEVTLLDHALVAGGAESAVRFHLSARWGDRRVAP